MNAPNTLPSLKSGRTHTSNEPWAILIALASLIIVATGIAIVVICILWEKYKKSRILFERNMTGLTFEIPPTASITNIELRPKEYEIQSLDMYVPQDGEDLGGGGGGEINFGFGSRDCGFRRSLHQHQPIAQPIAQLPPPHLHHQFCIHNPMDEYMVTNSYVGNNFNRY